MVTIIASHRNIKRITFGVYEDELDFFLKTIKSQGYTVIEIIYNKSEE